jgi:acetolactate synthase-1/2/3 large subunit
MKAGSAPGPRALTMIDLENPRIDWQAMAKAMGVPAVAVDTAEDFHKQLARSMDADGPVLIEVRL